MKTKLMILILIVLSVSCRQKLSKSKDEIDLTINKKKEATIKVDREDFFVFFQDFCLIKEYQLNRIKFPLKESYLSEDLNEILSKEIKREDWKYIKLKNFENNTIEYYFDDFNKLEIPDTDEKVYSIIGIENGISINYYFKRINGIWFLIKIEDQST